MRATSFRRRSGIKVHALELGGTSRVVAAAGRDLTVPLDTPGSATCHCGANVMVLASGRLKGHAPGGVTPSIKRGRYKCEGSGNDGSS